MIADEFSVESSGMDLPYPGDLGDATTQHSECIGVPSLQQETFEPQALDFDCAIQAQVNLANHFLSTPITESHGVFEAARMGILSENGTSMADCGKLLDFLGVPTHQTANASMGELITELSQGHGVIVGVNSRDLWEPGFRTWLEDQFGKPADHAITVTGIDFSDPSHPMVIINDTGIPDGGGSVYPLDQFQAAWEGSNHFYVATNHPLPGFDHSQASLYHILNADGRLDASPEDAFKAGKAIHEMSQTDWDKYLANH
jgi:hypothetical protein